MISVAIPFICGLTIVTMFLGILFVVKSWFIFMGGGGGGVITILLFLLHLVHIVQSIYCMWSVEEMHRKLGFSMTIFTVE